MGGLESMIPISLAEPAYFEALRTALAFFNSSLLFWLGLTVFFYADTRSSGVYFAFVNLIAGGLFFLLHSLNFAGRSGPVFLEWLWYLEFWILFFLPAGWYLVVLYYLGFWDPGTKREFSRHRILLPALLILLMINLALIILGGRPPSLREALRADPSFVLESWSGIIFLPTLAMYLTLATVPPFLALLAEPAPEKDWKGRARGRARLSMVLAAAGLAGVSLLVIALLGVAYLLNPANFYGGLIGLGPYLWLGEAPVLILISFALITLGRAIISYEIFSQKALPRLELARHWNIYIAFAALYAFLITRAAHPGPHFIVYLLSGGLLGTVFFVVLGRRSARDRRKHIKLLRPFVGSQRLYENFLAAGAASPDVATPFSALARDVLGVTRAHLIPLGVAAPLIRDPINYPEGLAPPAIFTEGLYERLKSPGDKFIELSPETVAAPGLIVLPLWSERGPVGCLLLGEKSDGGQITLEEAEVAQAAGERILDTLSGARLQSALMRLQREHIAEHSLQDEKARRTLHDDVLPELHAIMLKLDSLSTPEASEVLGALSNLHGRISDLLRAMPPAVHPEVIRLGFLEALQVALERERRESEPVPEYVIAPEANALLADIPARVAEVLFYACREAVRNARRHGLDPANPTDFKLRLSIRGENGILVLIEDNGRGSVEPEPGAQRYGQKERQEEQEVEREGSNTAPFEKERKAGTGTGLSLYSAMLAVVGGSFSLGGRRDEYTRVRIHIPEEALSREL